MHWLEGETVKVMADGAAHPDVTITNGAATLDYEAESVVIGYSYNSDGKLLPLVGATNDGSAQGKKNKARRIGFRVLDTLGLKYGPDFDNLEEILEAKWGDNFGEAPGLFTGIYRVGMEGDFGMENYVCWRCDGPFPGTILAAMPQLDVSDDT